MRGAFYIFSSSQNWAHFESIAWITSNLRFNCNWVGPEINIGPGEINIGPMQILSASSRALVKIQIFPNFCYFHIFLIFHNFQQFLMERK